MTRAASLRRLSLLLAPLLGALAVFQAAPAQSPPAAPTNIQVAPGNGVLTVTWNVSSRAGVEDSEIWHVLRWSQEPGVWNNPRDPRAVGRNDGLSVDPGLTSYTITGLKNGVATGVFIRSMVGHRNNMSERDGNSSEWVRTKGEQTTPVAPPNNAHTVADAIADATIANQSGTHQVSLSGVFSDADGDDLTITASSSNESVATVAVSNDTLTVTARSRGSATITVTARDSEGNSVSDAFDVTVAAAEAAQQQVDSAPGQVVNLSLRQVQPTRIRVEWDPPADGGGVNSYRVLLSRDGEELSTRRPGAKKQHVVIRKLEPGATYTVSVRAKNADGLGPVDTAQITLTLSVIDDDPAEARAQQEQQASAQQRQAPVNQPPTVAAPISDISGLRPGEARSVSLSGVFADADGDALTIRAEYGAAAVATVSVARDGASLTVTAVAEGTTTITVTAEDADGNRVIDAFTVTVPADQSRTSVNAAALVSNFEQPRRLSEDGTNNFVLAQGFSTGNAAAALGSIEVLIGVPLHARHTETVRAELWSAAAGGGPVSKLLDLDVPERMNVGAVAFAALSGVKLSANTKYFFVLYTTGRVDLRVVATFSEDEDAIGQDGWRIADIGYYVSAQTPDDGSWIAERHMGVMKIRINGPPDADAPQTATR